MKRIAATTLLFFSAIGAASTAARAEPPASSWQSEIGTGASFLLPPHAAQAAPGFTLQLAAAHRWRPGLRIGVRAGTRIHRATVPPPPVDEYLQIVTGAVEVGADFPLFARLRMLVIAGAGASWISSNLFEKVGTLDPGEFYSWMISGRIAIEHQSGNRHYAIGVGSDYSWMLDWDDLKLCAGVVYLRYLY